MINQDRDNDGKCDLNCDTDNDGKPDTNVDTNGDGKCDLNCQPESDIYEGTYVIELQDIHSINEHNIQPGWSGTQTFKINNPNNVAITYDLEWTGITNNFTNVNNLYYSLKRDGITIIKDSRAPYGSQTLKNNETIAPNSEIEYSIVYEFKETNKNQNTDINKTFKSNIRVTAHEIR